MAIAPSKLKDYHPPLTNYHYPNRRMKVNCRTAANDTAPADDDLLPLLSQSNSTWASKQTS